MSSSYTPPTGPPGMPDHGEQSEPPQEYSPAYGAAKSREGTSVKTAVLLIVIAGLIGLVILGALVWAVTRVAPTLLPGGDEEPGAAPTAAVAQPSQTREPGPTASSPVASPETTNPARTTEPEAPAARSGTLTAPTGDPLFSEEGEFTEMVLESRDEFAIDVPEHDGPLVITWSVTSERDNAGVFLNAYESKGGEMTEHIGAVENGQTGTWIIDANPDAPKTTVLYPEGNGDTQWKVEGFPLSDLPRVERGAEVSGSGPAAFAIPAGDEQDYRFASEEGVPRVEVYDADNLSSWTQFEFGTGPVELDVTAGGDEQVFLLHADSDWTLQPR